MARLNKSWIRLILTTLLLSVTAFGVAQPARAQGIVYGDTIPAGQVVERDVILTGNEVTIDGTVVGDVVALGSSVSVNGKVEGSLVAIGQTVSLSGEVGGSVYVAAETLQFDPSAVVGNSAYAVGASLVLDAGSQISRDLNVISFGAQFNGQIGRDVRAIIGPIEIIRVLLKATGWNPRPFIPQASPAEGPGASQSSGQTQVGAVSAYLGSDGVAPVSWVMYEAQAQVGPTPRVETPSAQAVDAAEVGEWFLERLRQLVTLLLIGLLALWLIPVQGVRAAAEVRARPLAATGYGLIGLVTGFVGTFLLALVVLAAVAGLLLLTLWRLALVVGGIGFLALGFAFIVFLMFAFFGTKVTVSYLIGQMILERMAPQATLRKIWPLLLGLLIYVLVSAVPYLGWAVSFVFILLGLGSAWLAYLHQRRSATSQEVVVASETA